ncbi:flagellar biosynthetic protein FliR [Muricoccus radiodurans]|uniref:flagellar biosynthetic protein FliR n=1 Tax=Muricoccus radiodurans TaxID=2231721 RepID=UPI003CFAA500
MTEAEFLVALPDLAFQAVLLFSRLGAAVMILPGLGEAEVPPQIRLGLGLGLVLLVLPVLAPFLPPVPDAAAEALRLVTVEIVIGLWIGGMARLLAMAFSVAMQAAASLVGLASVLVQDPAVGSGATALGRLGSLAAAVIVLSGGLYALPLRALVDSYALIPAGGSWPAGAAAEELAEAGAAMLALGLRLAGPFVMASVLINLALALIARVAPQIQVFFVASPGAILAGLGLLALLGPPLVATFTEALVIGWASLPGLR